MQNRVGKLILGLQTRAPSVELRQTLGWKDVATIHKSYKLLLVYKSVNNMMPAHMSELFTTCRQSANRATRQATSYKLVVPRVAMECAADHWLCLELSCGTTYLNRHSVLHQSELSAQ